MAKADLSAPRGVRIGVAIAAVLLQVLVVVGLVHALAPRFTASVVETVTSTLRVTITAPPPKPEPPPPPKAAGEAAPPGKKANPRPESAPKAKVPLSEKGAPARPGDGNENKAGAGVSGDGPGAGGQGNGAGGGGTKLEKIAGDINSARDYPKAGRKERSGDSVTIQMRVGVDGRASNCRVVKPSRDPEADRITCQLAVERFRFRPRTDGAGNPVPGEYAWRQRWWDPRD